MPLTLSDDEVNAGARLEAGHELATAILTLRAKIRAHEVNKSEIAQNVTIQMVDINKWVMMAEAIVGFDKLMGDRGKQLALGKGEGP